VIVAYVLDMESHGIELFGEDRGGRSAIPPTAMFSNDGDPTKPGELLVYMPENAVVTYSERVYPEELVFVGLTKWGSFFWPISKAEM
jgi:hypothetical protein